MAETGAWRSEDWWVSPFDFEGGVKPPVDRRVEFHDATLRDGEQTPGVVFRKDEKVRIAAKLAEAGVQRIEAGMPAVSDEDAQAIKEIVKMNLGSKIYAFCRATKGDIDKAVECGVSHVVIESPSGVPKIKYQLGWTEEEAIERAVKAVSYAKDQGLNVCFFPFDTTRADMGFLRRLVDIVMAQGKPDSMAVIDTTGCASPAAVRWLVSRVKSWVDIPIEVHTHNDLGLATATSVAGVEGGAGVIHVCVNGLGERTGNASLDEVALVLKLLYGVETGLDFQQLSSLSKLVEDLSRIKLARNKPVVGESAFMREIGLGMEVVYKMPLAVFPYKPEVVGQQIHVVLGKKSGKESISVKARELGVEIPEEMIGAVLDGVKRLGTQKKACLTDEEFLDLVKKVRG
ncbi:MAG: 3-hydroxy-3-methylglutaryl-CoA lyase [Firmicutes bacterium]|nr:3-hydroxy-3-methylglutaryl-CoA lyase [Bacillota bacterium]